MCVVDIEYVIDMTWTLTLLINRFYGQIRCAQDISALTYGCES